jgi:hypothetical protein
VAVRDELIFSGPAGVLRPARREVQPRQERQQVEMAGPAA